MDNDEIKTLLYADDMTVTLANTSSVEIFMQIQDNFKKMLPGLRMKFSKPKAMWVVARKRNIWALSGILEFKR